MSGQIQLDATVLAMYKLVPVLDATEVVLCTFSFVLIQYPFKGKRGN